MDEEIPIYMINCAFCRYSYQSIEGFSEAKCVISGNYDKYHVNNRVYDLIMENKVSGVCEFFKIKEGIESRLVE